MKVHIAYAQHHDHKGVKIEDPFVKFAWAIQDLARKADYNIVEIPAGGSGVHALPEVDLFVGLCGVRDWIIPAYAALFARSQRPVLLLLPHSYWTTDLHEEVYEIARCLKTLGNGLVQFEHYRGRHTTSKTAVNAFKIIKSLAQRINT